MLDLFSSGIMSLWLDMAGVGTAAPNAASVLAWRGGIPGLVVAEDLAFGRINAANPDLPAEATVQEYLKDLKDKNLIDGNQGIWVQAGMVPAGKSARDGADAWRFADEDCDFSGVAGNLGRRLSV